MKKNIAFIKFGGMSTGGTEKVLQTIASELPKDKYNVDFFYCDSAPYVGSDYKHLDTELSRVEYCLKNNVNLIKFNVAFKDITVPTHDWVDTNFWDYFKEENYDVILTGRAGHPEYPFSLIRNTKIIDTIHLSGMAENKVNVYKTVLISNKQREQWIKAGGPRKKSIIIPNPVNVIVTNKKYIFENKFVFGLHQRNDDYIFSEIPLMSYQKIENENTLFLILGGSSKYKEQASSLKIKNIKFFPTTSDINVIHKFLNSLDVYAHGRKDGEQCSTAIIEAMSHGLPIISHKAPSMGHAEQIGDAGLIAGNIEEYTLAMKKFMYDQPFYNDKSIISKLRYKSIYSIDSIMEQYINLIEEVIKARKINYFDKIINIVVNFYLKIKKILKTSYYKNLFVKLIFKLVKKLKPKIN